MNEKALEQVRADKRREASDGFDGTWIAHPDLLGPAREPFDEAFGSNPHQKVLRYDARHVSAAELLDIEGQGSTVTDDGVRSNVAVSIRYLESWIRGTGAVAIFNLMEDAATAEISRSQLWNWIQNDVTTESGAQVTPELVTRLIEEETGRAKSEGVGGGPDSEAWTVAADFLREIVLADELAEFVTLPAYERFM